MGGWVSGCVCVCDAVHCIATVVIIHLYYVSMPFGEQHNSAGLGRRRTLN